MKNQLIALALVLTGSPLFAQMKFEPAQDFHYINQNLPPKNIGMAMRLFNDKPVGVSDHAWSQFRQSQNVATAFYAATAAFLIAGLIMDDEAPEYYYAPGITWLVAFSVDRLSYFKLPN